MNVGSQVGDGGPLALCLRTGPSTRTSVTSSIPLTERQWSGAASAAWSGSTTRSRSSPAPPDPGVNFQGKGGFNPQRLVGAAATAGARHWGGHAEGFNPQRLVGAAATGEQGRVGVEAVVSILSGSSEPLQRASRGASGSRRSFQSSAARRSRCNLGRDLGRPRPRVPVSILSGSSEPLQRSPLLHPTSRERFNPQRLVGAAATVTFSTHSRHCPPFQSSAARRSRCNFRASATSWAPPAKFQSSAARRSRCNLLQHLPFGRLHRCFNPQRLVGAAATREGDRPAGGAAVSILSGSSEPLQPALPCRGGPRREVSILSGSSEPLQRGRLRSGRSDPVSILSGSSEPLQRQEEQANRPERGFQSSAARRSRCNARGAQGNAGGLVSILSGSSEPLQPARTSSG